MIDFPSLECYNESTKTEQGILEHPQYASTGGVLYYFAFSGSTNS